jgi:anthranilate 1,2-dioxygenase large subunit
MEDTEATELVQAAIERDGDKFSIAYMGIEAPDSEQGSSGITENMIRTFWRGYQKLMGL